jgi:hypothetical protein
MTSLVRDLAVLLRGRKEFCRLEIMLMMFPSGGLVLLAQTSSAAPFTCRLF